MKKFLIIIIAVLCFGLSSCSGTPASPLYDAPFLSLNCFKGDKNNKSYINTYELDEIINITIDGQFYADSFEIEYDCHGFDVVSIRNRFNEPLAENIGDISSPGRDYYEISYDKSYENPYMGFIYKLDNGKTYSAYVYGKVIDDKLYVDNHGFEYINKDYSIISYFNFAENVEANILEKGYLDVDCWDNDIYVRLNSSEFLFSKIESINVDTVGVDVLDLDISDSETNYLEDITFTLHVKENFTADDYKEELGYSGIYLKSLDDLPDTRSNMTTNFVEFRIVRLEIRLESGAYFEIVYVIRQHRFDWQNKYRDGFLAPKCYSDNVFYHEIDVNSYSKYIIY